jgi:hypothetical protein
MTKGLFTRGPKSQLTLRSIPAISAVESMEVGTCHLKRVLSPKYDVGAYVAIFVGGEAFKKLDPTLNTSAANTLS